MCLPYHILVLDSINNPLDQKEKQMEVVTRASTGRGHHHLPKNKGLPEEFSKLDRINA